MKLLDEETIRELLFDKDGKPKPPLKLITGEPPKCPVCESLMTPKITRVGTLSHACPNCTE